MTTTLYCCHTGCGKHVCSRDRQHMLSHGAGLGAAWLWQGAAGEPLSPQAVQEMANFLSTAHPRLRVLGGSRFNTSQTPATEWAEFGSYCFMLPRYCCNNDVLCCSCSGFTDHVEFLCTWLAACGDVCRFNLPHVKTFTAVV